MVVNLSFAVSIDDPAPEPTPTSTDASDAGGWSFENVAASARDGVRHVAERAGQAADDLRTAAAETASAVREGVQQAANQVGETADDVKAKAGETADAVRERARDAAERVGEVIDEAEAKAGEAVDAGQRDPLGSGLTVAAEGLSRLGPLPGHGLADELADAATGFGEAVDPRGPARGGPLPDIDAALRLRSDVVLDEVRQAHDQLADPDTPLPATIILSNSFAAALVAAGLEQYVVNPLLAAPAEVVEASQLYARAADHIGRGEYRLANQDLHAANAKLESAVSAIAVVVPVAEGETVAENIANDARAAAGRESRVLADEVADEFRTLQQRADDAGDVARDVREHLERPAEPEFAEPHRMEQLDPGADPTWEPDGRVQLPAAKNGQWLDGAVPGDGRWEPYRPAELGLEPGDSIPFRDGVPDLTEFAVDTPAGEPGTFTVDGMTFERAGDFRLADELLGERAGMSAGEVAEWRADRRLTYHHYAGDELQLVPQRLHGGLHHQGSVAERAGAGAAAAAADAAEAAEPRFRVADPDAPRVRVAADDPVDEHSLTDLTDVTADEPSGQRLRGRAQ